MTQVPIFSLFFLFIFQFHLLQCEYIYFKEKQNDNFIENDDELPKLKISEKCELDGICDNVENYPTALVKELIIKLKKDKTIFNYDKGPLPRTNETVFPLNLCETRTENKAPQSAKNTKGIWKFILNDAVEPIQVFRTTICKESPLRCSDNIVFRPGYDGKCVQKWVYRQMFYVNETKQAAVDFFGVPACCSCILIRRPNLD